MDREIQEKQTDKPDKEIYLKLCLMNPSVQISLDLSVPSPFFYCFSSALLIFRPFVLPPPPRFPVFTFCLPLPFTQTNEFPVNTYNRKQSNMMGGKFFFHP